MNLVGRVLSFSILAVVVMVIDSPLNSSALKGATTELRSHWKVCRVTSFTAFKFRSWSPKKKKDNKILSILRSNALTYSHMFRFVDRSILRVLWHVRIMSVEVCSMSADSGSCSASHRRWAFDVETRVCKEFVYGGCEGNRNRFSTQEDCLKSCLPAFPTAFNTGTCDLLCVFPWLNAFFIVFVWKIY